MSEEKVLEVLGPGCPRCKETYRVVQHVVESEGLPFRVVKNESIHRMVELGVMTSPAVVLGSKVLVAGRIPKAEEMRQILQQALGE